MKPDYLNALFEFGAALFILNNCRILHQQKLVRGVSVVSTTFFFLWGAFNVWFYPAVGQAWSFRAGVLVAMSNLLWIGLMIYYKRCEAGPH